MQENDKAEHSGTNGNMRGSKEQTKENMGRRLSDTMLNRNNIGNRQSHHRKHKCLEKISDYK